MAVIDTRNCEQCGTSFVPRREHARFCSARCRVTWNRQHVGDPPTAAGALGWTITAMQEAIDRLQRAGRLDQPHAFAVISEAVWWVTMVDATLVRYHPDAYDVALASRGPKERRCVEGTFGGLRFVRNWMGYHADHADFIRPQPDPDRPDAGPVAGWTWRSLPEPVLAGLPGPRAGMGDDQVPGVPGPSRGPARGRDVPERGGLPQPGLRGQPARVSFTRGAGGQ